MKRILLASLCCCTSFIAQAGSDLLDVMRHSIVVSNLEGVRSTLPYITKAEDIQQLIELADDVLMHSKKCLKWRLMPKVSALTVLSALAGIITSSVCMDSISTERSRRLAFNFIEGILNGIKEALRLSLASNIDYSSQVGSVQLADDINSRFSNCADRAIAKIETGRNFSLARSFLSMIGLTVGTGLIVTSICSLINDFDKADELYARALEIKYLLNQALIDITESNETTCPTEVTDIPSIEVEPVIGPEANKISETHTIDLAC